MAATWKGYLSFGLVSIPVSLTPAARTERISFNQLHSVCHSRLKQPLYCPKCERLVERTEIERGYEYEKDQYVFFTPEELDAIEPDSARAMNILEFVKLDEIDPVYFDASYYVAPEEGGVHAYHLLTNSMRKSGYAGIAKVSMHNREYFVIIRPASRGLTLHTMFYNNEIRDQQSTTDPSAGNEQETALAIQLIQNLAAPFQPEKYRDEYQLGLQKLIDAKTQGLNVPATSHAIVAPVIDLMAALKQSLSQSSAAAAPQKRLLQAVPKKEEPRRKKKAG